MAKASEANPAALDTYPLIAEGLHAVVDHVRKLHTVTSMSTAHPLEAVHYLNPLPDPVPEDAHVVWDDAHERDDALG